MAAWVRSTFGSAQNRIGTFSNSIWTATLCNNGRGEVSWQNYPLALPAGRHTLEWRYTKDASLSRGLDAAFIDNVDLPLAPATNTFSAASLQLFQQPGGLMLQIQGQANQVYVVQATTNFVDWQNISTNVATAGMIHIVDPGAATNKFRFYRAIVP